MTREARDPTAANDRTPDLARGANRVVERSWYVGFVANEDAAIVFLSNIEVATAIVGITFRLAQIKKLLVRNRIITWWVEVFHLLSDRVESEESVRSGSLKVLACLTEHQSHGYRTWLRCPFDIATHRSKVGLRRGAPMTHIVRSW